MNSTKFLTKEELLRELGISKSTFYRRLKALNISTTGHLMSFQEAQRIRQALGFSNEASRQSTGSADQN